MRNLISVRLAPAMFTLAGSVVVGCYWASAQEAELGVATGETRLETIVIEGGGGPSEGTASYTVEETDSATKLELTARETPQTIVVVTNQIIEDFNLKDANEILKATPGVYVENERNVNSYQYFSRGYVLQTQFDGVPTASRVGDRDDIPPDSAMLDRVEVIQGATGLLTGAGDPGGVVNFVRKMPTDTFQASIEGDIDSWLGGRLVGDISGPINKASTIRGRVVAAHDLAESYIDYVENQNSLLYGVIQADVTETTIVTAGIDVEYYKTEGGAAYGNPTYHDGAFLDIPRSTNLGADWAQDRRHSQNYFLKVDQELPNDWSLQGQLAFANVSANFLESSTWGSVDPLTGLGAGIWGAREVWERTG